MKTEGKQCRVCGVALVVGENWLASYAQRNFHICRDCEYLRQKRYREGNKEKLAERNRRYRAANRQKLLEAQRARSRERHITLSLTPTGRAKLLVKGARRRAQASGVECTLTVGKVAAAIGRGVCPRTGCRFDLTQRWGRDDNRRMNPLAPSVDRIDPSGPYSDENVQIVVWQYNVAKHSIPDRDFIQFCRRVVRTADKKVAKCAKK